MPALLYRDKLPRPDDPELVETIQQAVSLGIPLRFAATLAGISEHTAYHWMTRYDQALARNPDASPTEVARELGSVAVFGQTVKRARAALVAEQVALWREGGKDWASRATLLERLFPEDFGRRPAQVTIDNRQVHVSLARGQDADTALHALATRLLEVKETAPPAQLPEGGGVQEPSPTPGGAPATAHPPASHDS